MLSQRGLCFGRGLFVELSFEFESLNYRSDDLAFPESVRGWEIVHLIVFNGS